MKVWKLLGGLVMVTALLLGVGTVAPSAFSLGAVRPAAASNGNLSSRDNCRIGVSVMTDDGRLPGGASNWALYDAGYSVTDWTKTPGLVFYKCQAISFAYGFANFDVTDSDRVFGGSGYWAANNLHGTVFTRQRFSGYTMQYCGGRDVTPTRPGAQCF